MENSLRTLWVFNQFASTPETNNPAGIRHHSLIKYLENEGWRLKVFSASRNHLFQENPKRKFPYHEEKITKHSSFIWMWMFNYNPNSAIQRLTSWLLFSFMLFFVRSKHLSKPNVILVSSMSLWPIINAILVKIFHPRTKIIFETRDIWPLTPVLLGDISPSNPVVLIMGFLEKLGYRHASKNVSVLPFANRRISEVIGSEATKFSWIPNAIEIPEKKAIQDYSRVSNSPFRIVYAGAIGYANRLDILLEASGIATSNIEVCIYGEGNLKKKLMAQYASNSSIVFNKKIKKTEVYGELLKADLLYIGWHRSPLYAYGVSANKYNDYMLAEKPIISVGKLEFDPVIEANCGFSVDTMDPVQLAQVIDQIVQMDLIELQHLGANGLQYVKKNNSYKVISEQYLEVLENLGN